MAKEHLKESIKYYTETMKHFGTLSILLGTIFFSLTLGDKSPLKSDWVWSAYLTSLIFSAGFFAFAIVFFFTSHSKVTTCLKELKALEESEKK